MKTCPQCGSRYTDETLSFCLSDGARLIDEPAGSVMTVVLGETETSVRTPHNAVSEIGGYVVDPAQPNSRTWIAVLVTIVGMLILFGVVGVIGLVIWMNMDRPSVSNANIPDERRQSNSNIAVAITPQPQATPTPAAVKPTPRPTIEKTPEPTPERSEKRANYAPTMRLTMGRGAYSVPFSGEINPGDSRTFVLACRAGQALSGTISGGGCVAFSGGGRSISRTTSAGDNYVTVTNNCTSVARFSLRISIL